MLRLLSLALLLAAIGPCFGDSAPGVRTMPPIKGVDLPPLQPLINAPSRYPIGNGVAVLISRPNGELETCFGPGYSTSDLIGWENVSISVDKASQPLNTEMRRAAGTGIFYGLVSRGDVDIGVIDFTSRNEPWISRLFVLRNKSATTRHSLVFHDNIGTWADKARSNGPVADENGKPAGYFSQADTSMGVANFKNPADQTVIISFNRPATAKKESEQAGSVESDAIDLAPGEQKEIALTHYFISGHAQTNTQALAALRSLNADAGLAHSIAEWKKWFADVPPAYALDKIKDPRGRVLTEGALVILKANKSSDGGVIAHTTYYKEGYIRDAAMAIRGLLAAGHTEEAKQWLLWCNKKFTTDGYFADAMSCLPSLDDRNSDYGGADQGVEEPGWVLLCARDYFKQTHDLAFLKSIDPMLRYCADALVRNAMANDGRMEFNGDETEICRVIDFGATGCMGVRTWALSSVAMAAASLDFVIDYVKVTGGDPARYQNAKTHTTVDLAAEKQKLVVEMHRDFWRTDVADIPGGFNDFARIQGSNDWPKARLVNLTLMPVFFSTDYPVDEKKKDVAAMAQYFDPKTGFLQLVPQAKTGSEGQDLGYLLWGLVETGDARKDAVYQALVNGKTPDAWGGFSEAYDPDGKPNGHDLRSLETGVNVSALAKYWALGGKNAN